MPSFRGLSNNHAGEGHLHCGSKITDYIPFEVQSVFTLTDSKKGAKTHLFRLAHGNLTCLLCGFLKVFFVDCNGFNVFICF